MSRHPEHDEQVAVVQWWRQQYPKFAGLLFASANGLYLGGTPRQRAVRWALFEKSGGRAGVADLFLALSSRGFHGLWIEMKATKGGRLSQDQKDFIADMREQDYAAYACKGADSAIDTIKDYMREGL